jgi:xylulokinase
MTRDELLLGIDIGTLSVKGVLATPDGEVVASEVAHHTLAVPCPGWAEHDAETAWWEGPLAVIRSLVAHERGNAIRGVAVSGIGPAFCPTDKDGQPLRGAILYGIDVRASAEASTLEEALGRDRILRRTGSVLTSQALGPKLLWYRRHEPDLYAQTKLLLPASAFLLHRLTGEYAIDRHTACYFNPLFDIENGSWIGDSDWREPVLGSDHPPLPAVRWTLEPAGEITSRAAALTGLRSGTPVTVGTIDSVAEALSVGVRRPGDLMLQYGSTMYLILVTDTPSADARFWSASFALEGTTAVEAGMATSGLLTEWFRTVLGENAPSFDQLTAEAARTEPGSDGLVILPYFSGERTPIHDPDARGVIFGLRLGHERGHIYRALLEATAFGARHILEVLGACGQAPRRVVAVGGGASSSVWPQIVSDVTGLEQQLPAITIGASYGDAWVAGVATGLVDPTVDWTRMSGTTRPTGVDYEGPYEIYRALYPATRELMHRTTAGRPADW